MHSKVRLSLVVVLVVSLFVGCSHWQIFKRKRPAAGWKDSKVAQQIGTISGSKAVRVTARIAFDSGQRVTSEVVIFILDGSGEVYRIMTWRDDLDDAPADQRNRIVTR